MSSGNLTHFDKLLNWRLFVFNDGTAFSGNFLNNSHWFLLRRESSCRPSSQLGHQKFRKLACPSGTTFNKTSDKRNQFWKKMRLEILSTKYRQFCLGRCDIQYIPWNMHTAWLRSVLLWWYYNQFTVYFLMARLIVRFSSLIPGVQTNFSYDGRGISYGLCPPMNVNWPYWWQVNIGSGNGLVSTGSKAFNETVCCGIVVCIQQLTKLGNIWPALFLIHSNKIHTDVRANGEHCEVWQLLFLSWKSDCYISLKRKI